MKRITWSILLALMAGACLSAQSYPYYFYAHHYRPSDPRSMGMGLSGVALSEGAMVALTNPAGLVTIEKTNVSYTHLFPTTISGLDNNVGDILEQETFILAHRFNKFTLAFGYFDLEFGKIFTPYLNKSIGARQFQLSAASSVIKSKSFVLNYGATIKYLDQYYGADIYHSKTFLFDVGTQIQFGLNKHNLIYSLSMSNLGPKIKFENQNNAEEEAIRMLRVGVAFGSTSTRQIEYTITAEFQKNINSDDHLEKLWQTVNFGAELTFLQHFYGRVGYVVELIADEHINDIEGMTFGFGFAIPKPIQVFKPIYLSVNYARGLELGTLERQIVNVAVSF